VQSNAASTQLLSFAAPSRSSGRLPLLLVSIFKIYLEKCARLALTIYQLHQQTAPNKKTYTPMYNSQNIRHLVGEYSTDEVYFF